MMIIVELISAFMLLIIASNLLRALINATIPFDSVRLSFFFPGILIHEAAHAGVSKLLGVPVQKIDFIKGEVQINPGDVTPLKNFIIAIIPLFISWLLGGVSFIGSIVMINVNQWVLGICLLLLALSIYSCAAPSLTDIANILQGKNEVMTTGIWVLISGIIGFLVIFELSHHEILALVGAMGTAILGYIAYQAAQNASEEKGKWVI